MSGRADKKRFETRRNQVAIIPWFGGVDIYHFPSWRAQATARGDLAVEGLDREFPFLSTETIFHHIGSSIQRMHGEHALSNVINF